MVLKLIYIHLQRNYTLYKTLRQLLVQLGVIIKGKFLNYYQTKISKTLYYKKQVVIYEGKNQCIKNEL